MEIYLKIHILIRVPSIPIKQTNQKREVWATDASVYVDCFCQVWNPAI